MNYLLFAETGISTNQLVATVTGLFTCLTVCVTWGVSKFLTLRDGQQAREDIIHELYRVQLAAKDELIREAHCKFTKTLMEIYSVDVGGEKGSDG